MWARIDDGFADHPKILAAGAASALLYVRSLCYASRYLTDGIVPTTALPKLLTGLEHLGETPVAGLLQNRLWEKRGDDYRIHDYLDYNPPRRMVLARRRAKSDAGKLGADGRWGPREAANSVKNRPQRRFILTRAAWTEMRDIYGRCLKCGSVPENGGLVRDHVIPRFMGGKDDITNIQPLCQKCNSKKGREVTDYRVGLPETRSEWLPKRLASASHEPPTLPATTDMLPSRPVPSVRKEVQNSIVGLERPTPPSEALGILDFLNQKAGRHYRPVKENLRLIQARLASGATPDDLRSVVARQVRLWNGDAKMREYLRPATLFGATNFEQYLGQLRQETPAS